MDTIKILLIEDSEIDYDYLIHILKKESIKFFSKRIETSEEVRLQMRTVDWDIVISDNSLPTLDAKTALGIVKSIDSEVPFIIVSGAIGEENAVSAMKSGANDYINKDNLSRLVPVIQREIKEARIRKKKKESEEDLLTFIYRSSHDLKAPAASMTGLINLMKEENDPVIMKNSVQHLDKSLIKLNTTIEQLLTMFRVKEMELTNERNDLSTVVHDIATKNRYHIKYEKIHLLNFCRRIIDNYKYITGFSEVTFTISIDDHLNLKSDPFLMESILGNLIENAIKYRDKSKQSFISIQAYQVAKKLMILIKDNGQGIRKSAKNDVFQMFFRGNTNSLGNGLGLYITKCGIEKLGGEISLFSTYGKGTIFKIVIPC